MLNKHLFYASPTTSTELQEDSYTWNDEMFLCRKIVQPVEGQIDFAVDWSSMALARCFAGAYQLQYLGDFAIYGDSECKTLQLFSGAG